MAAKDRAERVLIGRQGAHTLHATHDSRELTASARQKWAENWEHRVDPEGVLPPAERAKRAEHAMRAHMAELRSQERQAASEAGCVVSRPPTKKGRPPEGPPRIRHQAFPAPA